MRSTTRSSAKRQSSSRSSPMTDPSGPDSASPVDAPLSRREAARARRAQSAVDAGAGFQTHMRAARTEFENQYAHPRAAFEDANARITQSTAIGRASSREHVWQIF